MSHCLIRLSKPPCRANQTLETETVFTAAPANVDIALVHGGASVNADIVNNNEVWRVFL